MPEPLGRPAPEPSDESQELESDSVRDDAREKKKKDKVRSAWISFVGRIVAQVVGAVVTVALTLFVVQRAQREPTPGPAPQGAMAAQPAEVAAATGPRPAPRMPPGELSLAVLPLDNFSGDPSQGYFADGMTEALIAELTQIKGVRVISRTSSMQYRGTHKPLPEIARELGVTHLIEGSVVREHARVRVTAQLIDAASDRHVWARTYDRVERNLLEIQAEFAAAIAADVDVTVAAAQADRAQSGGDPIAAASRLTSPW